MSPRATRPRLALAALAAGALAAAPAALTATELPVRAVVLSSSGMAQVTLEQVVPPEAPAVTFRVPLADVDDVLRSLVVADTAGRVAGLRLPARDLAAEAFRGLPLRPDDFASRSALLNALRGQRAEAAGTEGRIAEASDAAGVLRLTLLTGSGLRVLALREGDGVRLLDEALAARIERAAEALAATRTADTRVVTIALAPGAPGPRRLQATYVAGAPLWKPSWRIAAPGFGVADAQARLMGWAVVENHSGADWRGIRLSLVSGEAVAFRQAIYTPLLLPRTEVPVRGGGPVAVLPDSGGLPEPVAAPPPAPTTRAMRVAPPAAPAMPLGGIMPPMPAPAPIAEAARPALEATAEASLGRVAFTLAEPVNLPAGETANLPFLDATLPAERLWWLQDVHARHPLQALRLTNDTPHPLPGGLATLYGTADAERDRFLGDAEILPMPPGAVRLLAFAEDRGLQFATTERDEEVVTAIAFRRGTLELTLRLRHHLAMAVEGGGTAGPLVVDLPDLGRQEPEFEPDARGDFGLRVQVALTGGTDRFAWAWSREQRRPFALWDDALAAELPRDWRGITDFSRLPGGTDRLAALRRILAELPDAAEGRDRLAALIDEFAAARAAMDAFRTALRDAQAAEAALARARRAVEDRSGAAREEARVALNTASRAAERAGTAADAAWIAWRAAAQRVIARTE